MYELSIQETDKTGGSVQNMHQTGGLRGSQVPQLFVRAKIAALNKEGIFVTVTQKAGYTPMLVLICRDFSFLRGHLHYCLIGFIRSLKLFGAYLNQQKTSVMDVGLGHRAMKLFLLASYEYYYWYSLLVDDDMLKLAC